MTARDLTRLLAEVAQATARCGLRATAPVVSCDAAGREGVWRHRFLPAHRSTNQGVDSSSIAGNHRQRRAKSEGLDVHKLRTMLIRYHHGERQVWRVVHASLWPAPTESIMSGRSIAKAPASPPALHTTVVIATCERRQDPGLSEYKPFS